MGEWAQQDRASKMRVLALRDRAVKDFTPGNWTELGIVTDCDSIVQRHDRLLRSMRFGDPDYPDAALEVLTQMLRSNWNLIGSITGFIDEKYPESAEGVLVSSADTGKPKIVFQPSVFDVPSEMPDPHLLSAMMPFTGAFAATYETIQRASMIGNMRCQRADDIWSNSAIIQDVFSLIYRSFIVVCDFTGRNPNVFYEAGIAHTLGKHVIPITQSHDDVPFDLRHHRYIHYLANSEGQQALQAQLVRRIATLRGQHTGFLWDR